MQKIESRSLIYKGLKMKNNKSVCLLSGIIFFAATSPLVPAFQSSVAPAVTVKSENTALKTSDEASEKNKQKIAGLIQQLEQLSQETQAFNLFTNRVYFSVLTALDLYSAAQISDEYYQKSKAENPGETANRTSVADSYKTNLIQVVNQQKAALDGAIDAAITEHNKLTLEAKNSGDITETPVQFQTSPGDSKSIFDLAGINVNSLETGGINEANERLYMLVYLKSYTGYAVGEIEPELAFDFYNHEPVTAVDPQVQLYITSDMAEKRASFANKLFEKEPEKAIAKLTNLKDKPMSFLTSEALTSFYKKDPKKAAQFAQKILDESFAELNTEDRDILYQKMSVYLYFLSYAKDGKLLSRTNPLITKAQAFKIIDTLINFYSAQENSESGGTELIYIADVIGSYSPEKANQLLQSSDYQIKPKKKNPGGDKSEPFTYDTPKEDEQIKTDASSDGNGSGSGGATIEAPDSPPPPAKPEPANNKPAPEVINQYFTQALQISNNRVSDAVFVSSLINISKVFNGWGEYEKAQGILNLAQNIISKAPSSSTDYTLRFNLAQAYIDSKNVPEALKITENALGYFEYFIQGTITTSRYNRANTDNFTDDGYELDSSLNSYYAYYVQSLITSNGNLFNALMDENPASAVSLSSKFTRRESQFIFKYYLLDNYLKKLQTLAKK